MRRKFWWKQLVFALCFAVTAGVVSPVVPVSAEELQESEAVEVESTELVTFTEAFASTEPVEESVSAGNVCKTVSGNDVTLSAVSDESVEERSTIAETEVVETADLSYTDENGNMFTYILDEAGNATITGITVSGEALVIPEMINASPVIAVDNANQCVVMNLGVAIPELSINCHTIGARAFYGTIIGTLTIGEDVKAFVVCNDGDYSYDYYYLQFAYAKIDKVVPASLIQNQEPQKFQYRK